MSTSVKRVAFYTRISTDEDKQKYSLDAQRDRLTLFCQGLYGAECEVAEVYRDTESGAKIDRPALRRMREDARAGRFDVVLVYKVDRLSRRLSDLVPLVEELSKVGVAFRSVTESFDTASPSGRAMMQMLGVFAELERATIIERTVVGMEKKASTGAWVGGTVPYGYRLQSDKKTLIPYDDEAFIVRRVFNRYATGGVGIRSLRDELTEDGHWKRTGKPWTPQTLLHMLRNPVYAGKIRWKTELHDGLHEPLVDQDLFDRVAEVLKNRAEDLKGRQWHTNSERIATGIILCGLCGKTMVGVSATKNGRKLPYYVCNGRLTKTGCRMDYIRADKLEAQIIADFSAMFRERGMVERVWMAASRLIAKERPDLETEKGKVTRDLAAAEESLDRYFSEFEAGTLDPKACAPRIAALRRQADALRGRLARLESQLARLQLPAIDLDEVQRLMDDFERQFASNSNPERKHLLHKLVKEVRVQSKDAAEVWYAFPRPRVSTGPFVDSPIWLGALVSLRAA